MNGQEWETIVKYSATERPFNGYPERIISPPRASSCCAGGMKNVGELAWDDNGPFTYKRCGACGYTVRHFFSVRGAAREEEEEPCLDHGAEDHHDAGDWLEAERQILQNRELDVRSATIKVSYRE